MSALSRHQICSALLHGFDEQLVSCLSSSEITAGVRGAAIKIANFIRGCEGRLWIAGNGGSAASAEHIALDLRSLGIRARAVGGSIELSACANDHGFENSYLRMIQSDVVDQDQLLVLSVSGSSSNLVQLILSFRARNLDVLPLLGLNGTGSIGPICADRIQVDSDDYAFVEFLHLGLVMAAIDELR